MSTGSRTTFFHPWLLSPSSTTSIVSGVPSMPIFTVSMSRIPRAASIWSCMSSGAIGTKRWLKSFFGSTETMHVRVPMP